MITDDEQSQKARMSESVARDRKSVDKPRPRIVRPADLMGEGHPMPAGSDVMGDRLYERESELEPDTDTGV